MKIGYCKGFKYQVARCYLIKTPIIGHNVETPYLKLSPDGTLEIQKGYAWDGASGPTYDSKCSIRGSLVHDALYQLIRLDLIGHKERPAVDQFFHDICVEDGMNKTRAAAWLWAVRKFGIFSAIPEAERPVLEAP